MTARYWSAECVVGKVMDCSECRSCKIVDDEAGGSAC